MTFCPKWWMNWLYHFVTMAKVTDVCHLLVSLRDVLLYFLPVRFKIFDFWKGTGCHSPPYHHFLFSLLIIQFVGHFLIFLCPYIKLIYNVICNLSPLSHQMTLPIFNGTWLHFILTFGSHDRLCMPWKEVSGAVDDLLQKQQRTMLPDC